MGAICAVHGTQPACRSHGCRAEVVHAGLRMRRWQAGGGLPGLANIYLAAMDALAPINPQARSPQSS